MTTTYYEKNAETIVACVLTQVALGFGFIMPFAQDAIWPRILLSAAVAVVSLILLQAVFIKRPVLIISTDSIYLRGLRPGFFKLVQLWHGETIPVSNIRKIEVGKIRKDAGLGVKLPPSGVPSKSAWNMEFFWITYSRDGQEEQLYYPFVNRIKNVQDALGQIRSMRDATNSYELTEYTS